MEDGSFVRDNGNNANEISRFYRELFLEEWSTRPCIEDLKGWNGTLFLSTQPSGWRDRLRKRKFIGRLSIWCKRKLRVLTVVGISSSMTCLKCLLSFILMVKLVSV